MKILWVSMNGALYNVKEGDAYGGIGWIGALYEQLQKSNIRFELGVAFLGNTSFKDVVNGISFYCISSKSPKGFKKWLYYQKGYQKLTFMDFYEEMESVIRDFHPDLIHLWGVENRLASVCHFKEVPVIAHLQGLLSQCIERYYPYATNAYSFRLNRFSIREWILNNGFIFGEKEMAVRAKIEKQHLKVVPAVMGRTHWDKQVALFNNPNVTYFHVDEALRTPFYQAIAWDKHRNNKFIIYSTISDTIYKGLDVIMKTAVILKEYNFFNFEWHVAGIVPQSDFVYWFEKNLRIKLENIPVKILGRQSPRELIEGLHNADLYVHPSYIDNSPNSLCEAQYLGVPCCATNVGGISSLIEDEVTGVLFPANSPYDLAFAIKDCFDHEDKWRFYAKNGQKVAHKRHNPETILNQLLFAYNNMIK